jgi:hypothetical protein
MHIRINNLLLPTLSCHVDLHERHLHSLFFANKVPTRFDAKGNRNDFFATRGADIAILTGFGMDLLVINY